MLLQEYLSNRFVCVTLPQYNTQWYVPICMSTRSKHFFITITWPPQGNILATLLEGDSFFNREPAVELEQVRGKCDKSLNPWLPIFYLAAAF